MKRRNDAAPGGRRYEQLRAQARSDARLLNGIPSKVKRTIAEADIVVASWTAPGDHGSLIIKGRRRVEAGAAAAEPAPGDAVRAYRSPAVKMAFVPCTSYEHAVMLRWLLGDGD